MPAIGGSNAAPAGNGGGGAGSSQAAGGCAGGGAGGGANYGQPIVVDTNQTLSTTGNYNLGTAGTWVNWNTTYVEAAQETAQETATRAARQRAADEIMRQRWAEQQEEREELSRQARAAAERASELLIEMLSDEQRATWADRQYFEVVGSASGRTYRIRQGIVNNVDRLSEDGTVRDRVLCAHPVDIPDDDCHLAQMLLLVTDEERFVQVSNHHGVAGLDAVLPENRDAYRERRRAEREQMDRHTYQRGAADQWNIQRPQRRVEGVDMEPVVVGYDPAFPDDVEFPPVQQQPIEFRYNMDVEHAITDIRDRAVHEAVDPRYRLG